MTKMQDMEVDDDLSLAVGFEVAHTAVENDTLSEERLDEMSLSVCYGIGRLSAHRICLCGEVGVPRDSSSPTLPRSEISCQCGSVCVVHCPACLKFCVHASFAVRLQFC